MTTAGRLLRLLRPEVGLVVVSAACRIVNQGLGVAIPGVAVALLLSDMSLAGIVFILFGLALVKGVFRYLEQLTGHAVAFRLLDQLRVAAFGWLERVDPRHLDDQRSGDLVARISGDIERVEPFYAHTIAPLAAAVAVPTVTLVWLSAVFGPIPVLTLGPVVLVSLLVVPWFGWHRVLSLGEQSRTQTGEITAAVAETVQGAAEIAVLGAATPVVHSIDDAGRADSANRRRLASFSAGRALVGGVMFGVAVVAAVMVFASAFERGDLDLTGLLVSLVVSWTILTPVRALEQIVPDTEQALAAARRLFEIEDLPAQIFGEAETGRVGKVTFEGVSVLRGDAQLLQSIDLVIEPGSFVGVVGSSGSGKSTLVSTLLRQPDVSTGAVLLDDVPIASLGRAGLSDAVAIVPQRPDIFPGTITANLLIAAPDAADSQLRRALERAQLFDWVDSLDHGIDTELGERGVGMSGGQRQRLAIARAFLRDPSVLILDEATSELDASTEATVLEEVYAERGDRTLIVVAHRMETLVDADRIVVLDSGRIVEEGAHEELAGANGTYSVLWERHLDQLVIGT